MIKNILFDLDGTITDPKIGITNSVKYALSKFNINNVRREDLIKFIGPPLIDSFMDYYDFSKEQSEKAIDFFREYFAVKGLYENKPYKNIEELLIKLKNNKYRLFVATSKPTVYAIRILKHFHLDKYFEDIVGSNLDHTRTAKKEIIQFIINQYNLETHHCIMIGDRSHDIIGANVCEIKAIAVMYGYGSLDEFKKNNPAKIVDLPEEIFDCIKSITL